MSSARTVVLKLGGEMCRAPLLHTLAGEIALVRQGGVRTVVVHGGGPQMSETLDRLGIERRMEGGRRITDGSTLEVAKMVFAGTVNTSVVAALNARGVKGVGLTGIDAGLVVARKRPPVRRETERGEELIDFGYVGDVSGGDVSLVRVLLSEGYVPVVASLAATDDGGVLNVNADTIATWIAALIGADSIVFVTTAPGVLREYPDPRSIIARLDRESSEALIATGVIREGMIPKIRSCFEALARGVPRAHIVSGMEAGALAACVVRGEARGTEAVVHPLC
jgi:acetylglutamate kinase